MKQLMTGNEAVARGAYEAGVRVGSAYPGTPSTEIFENLPQYKDVLYSEWAPNEKVAAEVAFGASMAGMRSMCAMKHVGMNVAADPLFTASYLGVGGAYILITADDPSMHSSQNEQDNRYYAKFSKCALIEPSDSQECKDFMKEACRVSEQFNTPVIFRVTTRVCHSKSLVELGEREEQPVTRYQRNPAKYSATPARAYVKHAEVEQRLRDLEEYACTSPLNVWEKKGSKIGVVTASIAYQYAKEVFPEDTSFLKLGFTYPLPMKLIAEFAKSVETLYVIEELEPFMEEQIRAAGIACHGKDCIPRLYELNPEIVRAGVFGQKAETKTVGVEAVGRPPVLCPGCPHRGFFYSVARRKNVIVTGDIGCYTLGGAQPLDATDSCLCMGGGFSVGAGLARALEMAGDDRRVIGIVGDSTFFHSGMTGAAEILYNNHKMIPCVLDNSITGMTGHQDNPGTGETLMGDSAPIIRVEDVLRGMGYQNIIVVDPQDLKAMDAAIDEALASEVPAAIITRRPCLLIKKIKHDIGLCVVDRDKCRSCKMCLKVGCPAVFIKEGKAHIDPTLCVGCTVCAQVCPFGAIERKGE